jgi:hypothetical protein
MPLLVSCAEAGLLLVAFESCAEFVNPLRSFGLRQCAIEFFTGLSTQRLQEERCASVIGSSPLFHCLDRVAAPAERYHAGATLRSRRTGLEVGHLRSVWIDPGEPDGVVVSASSGPYTRTWLAVLMAGSMVGSRASAFDWAQGAPSRSRGPVEACPRLLACCAPARRLQKRGLLMSAAYSVRTIAEQLALRGGYATSPQHPRGLSCRSNVERVAAAAAIFTALFAGVSSIDTD